MRRILLGGLGLALGALAPPALAQPTPSGAPPARAAAFGRPVAVADPQPTEITQTGLFRNGPTRPTVTYAPGQFGTPTPATGAPVGVPGYPPTGGPVVGMPPTAGAPVARPASPGGTVGQPVAGGPPTVTEVRDPAGRLIVPGTPIVPGGPGATFVPSVLPDGGPECVAPAEDPLFAGPTFAPNPVGRVAGAGRAWLTGEVLLWWGSGASVPPLVTTSPVDSFGIIGRPGTQVLLGGEFGESFRAGGRIGAGYWFGDNECRGIDGRLFWLAPTTATFGTNTNANPLLARPFFNVNPNVTVPNVGFGQSSEVVARPGVATGSVQVSLRNAVWGAELNYRRYLAGGPGARLDLLVGYRYLEMNERLVISERFDRVPGSDPNVGIPAVSGTITDSFRTENRFHGGQIGVAGSFQRGRWTLDPRATVAFGTVRQTVDINGVQSLTFPNGGVLNTAGGLLAVPGANIGTFSQNKFAVVPEVGLNMGWQATDRLKLFVGYNFLYLSSAVRAGEQPDLRLDAARVPNLLPPGSGMPLASPIRPQPLLSTSGYFVQGISFGLAYRW